MTELPSDNNQSSFHTSTGELQNRDKLQSILRGMQLKCPNCGKGKLFEKFLKVSHNCKNCSEELYHHRADDAPPYFTIFIVGHIIVSAVLAVEVVFTPAIWIHMLLWIPLTIILSLGLLSPIKGAVVGYQWALYLHGFDPRERDDILPANSINHYEENK